MFKEAIENILSRSAEHYARPDDYLGKDNFLHCAKCGGVKQESFKLLGYDVLTYIPCPCMKEAEAKEEAMKAERAKELRRREKIQRLRQQSKISGKREKETFENFIQNNSNRQQLAVAKDYVENFETSDEPEQGLLLYGNTGTGKTFLACCIGNALLEKGHSVYFTSTVKLLDRKKSYHAGDDEDKELDRLIETVDLLILDDLDAERHTDYANEIIYSVIDDRIDAEKPMIITTNLTISQLEDPKSMREQRIYERILDCCFPLKLVGKSFRKERAKKRFEKSNLVEKGVGEK